MDTESSPGASSPAFCHNIVTQVLDHPDVLRTTTLVNDIKAAVLIVCDEQEEPSILDSLEN